MKSNPNNNKGSTLPLVMIIVFVMILLSMALLDMGFIESKYAINQEQRTQSYYIARSSAHAMAAHIMNNPWDVDDLIGHTGTGEYAGGSFKVTVSKTTDENDIEVIRVHSTSELLNYNNSKSVTLKRRPSSYFFDNAIAQNSEEKLDLGDLELNSPETTSVPVESKGEISNPQNYNDNYENGELELIKKENPDLKFTEPHFPTPGALDGHFIDLDAFIDDGHGTDEGSGSNQVITIPPGNYSFEELKTATGTGTLRFNTNGDEQIILVENFDVKWNIEVVGGGRVSLFITHSGNINTQTQTGENPSDFIIYMAKDTTLNLETGQTFVNTYIYGPQSTIALQAQVKINGAIVGKIVRRGDDHPEGPNGQLNYIPIPDDIDLSDTLREYKIISWE